MHLVVVADVALPQLPTEVHGAPVELVREVDEPGLGVAEEDPAIGQPPDLRPERLLGAEPAAALDVRDAFPVRVISGVEGMEKPDPRIFELAMSRAGVAAEDSVYVGDNPEFDVDPPAALGMFTVLIDRRGRHEGHDGARITDLAELPGVLGL